MTIYNGRSDSRTDRALGMFVKTLPVSCQLGSSALQLFTTTKKQLLDSMDHDIYSFAEISRALGISAELMFVYQGDNFEFDQLAGLPTEALEVMSEGVIAAISIGGLNPRRPLLFPGQLREQPLRRQFDYRPA